MQIFELPENEFKIIVKIMFNELKGNIDTQWGKKSGKLCINKIRISIKRQKLLKRIKWKFCSRKHTHTHTQLGWNIHQKVLTSNLPTGRKN